ncbi:protein FAM131A isoform X2 [Sebastes umbrosus]|nr:protein FAM131A isoform X2 [Sebastes umbrosus]
MSDLALWGNTRTSLARRLILTAPLGVLDFSQVNVDDTIEMLPKSRRALTIQEIAALARSSLHGISQVVKDHVTKPTAMAQGRVAHLIEWKGWCRPIDTPAALESDFNSYSDLTEGEQEARFAAGVAEQFAIAEAKLRAWSSVDGDESNDDSYDEDFLPANEPTTQSTDVSSYPPYLKELIHSQLCQHLGLRGPCCEVGGGGGGGGEGGGSGEPSPTAGSPDTLCSSLCSLDEQHPLLRDLGGNRGNHSYSNAAELAAKILAALQGGEELLLARLQRAGQSARGGGDSGFHNLNGDGRGIRPCGGQDSPCYSMSYSETYLSPGEDDDTPCKDYESTVCQVDAEGNGEEYDPHRRVSDVASSGVVSLDEEDEEEEEERAGEPNNQ